MEDVVENKVTRELSEKYGKNEKIIRTIVEKCEGLGYNIQETKEIIKEFYQK